jgi:tRNA A-37 threonylcarbamoyl transferase component Bud32
MAMDEADVQLVRSRILPSRFRIKVLETSAGRVVAKKQRHERSAWRARAVDALARAAGIPILQAVPAHGGVRAQRIEVERLRSLRAAGLRVPEVLHVDAQFIVIGHLPGRSLVELIEAGGSAGWAAWQVGLDAIAEVHARGEYLSHAFARNFLAAERGSALAMIDFEVDPLEIFSLDEAQARDWLAYLHSTLWLLEPSPAAAAAVASRLAAGRPAVRALVDGVGRRLDVLRHLPRSRRIAGREVAGVRALAAFFPLPACPAPPAHPTHPP